MDLAYVRTIPSAMDLDTRSDPARSTRWIFEYTSVRVLKFLPLILRVKMQWDRLDAWLRLVELTFRM